MGNTQQNSLSFNHCRQCLQQTINQTNNQVLILQGQIPFAQPIQNNINPYAPKDDLKQKINAIIIKQKPTIDKLKYQKNNSVKFQQNTANNTIKQNNISAIKQDNISAIKQNNLSAIKQDNISAIKQNNISAIKQDNTKQNQINGMKLDQKYWKKSNPDIVIQGTWDQRYPHGLTKIYFPSGFIFVAYFYHGAPIYDDCLLIYPNCNYYHGSIMNGKFHGKGKYCSSDIAYEGNWIDNLPDGDGKQIYMQQHVEYIGKFKKGQKQAINSIYKKNQSHNILSRQLINSKKQLNQNTRQNQNTTNKSILKNQQVYRYEGQFKNNDFSGQGKIVIKNNTILRTNFSTNYPLVNIKDIKSQQYKLNGEFERDLKSGKGTIKCRHTNSRAQQYKGEFKNGKLNGVGSVISTNNITKQPQFVYWFNGYKLKRLNNFTDQKQTSYLLQRIQYYYKQAEKYSQIVERLKKQFMNKYNFMLLKQKQIVQAVRNQKSKQLMIELTQGKYVYVYCQ